MNFRYISLIALISASPVLAMDYTSQDPMNPKSKAATRLHAAEQHVAVLPSIAYDTKQKVELAQVKTQKEPAVATIAHALSQLPNNKSRSEKEKNDFYAMFASRMPVELQEYIGEFRAQSNAQFIDKHIKELIPCIIKRHPHHVSMRALMDDLLNDLNDYFNAPHEQLVDRESPYIIAVGGFWSFADEPRNCRLRLGSRNFSSDVTQWFALHYPNTLVNTLADNEWLAVLYSDGSIKWHVSKRNKARLNKYLTKEQLILGVALWEKPDFLKDTQLEVYRELPEQVTKSIQSNYEIACSQSARYIRKGLQCATGAGLLAANAYWSHSMFCKIDVMERSNHSLIVRAPYALGASLLAGTPLLAFMGLLYKDDSNRRSRRDAFNSINADLKFAALGTYVGLLSAYLGAFGYSFMTAKGK